MTIIKHRDICGLVGTLCGACIVTLVALGFGAAPARAQNFTPLPPQVKFIKDGKFTGTLLIEGKTLPITGAIDYLTGDTQYLKMSVDREGQLITSDTWLKQTSTAINQWEIVSTDPTTCRKEVLSGASYPQCNAWSRNSNGLYVQKCTVTAQGNKTTLDRVVQLSSDNQLVQMTENATITGENGNSPSNLTPVINPLGPPGSFIFVTDSLTITMTEQGTVPPTPPMSPIYPAPSIFQAFATPPTPIRGKRKPMQGHNPQHLFLGLVLRLKAQSRQLEAPG